MSGTPARGARNGNTQEVRLGVTPLSATRACMQIALPEHEGADVLGLALLWQHWIRTCVLGPLQTVAVVSAGTAQPCLSLSQLQKYWEDKVEWKIISQLGPSACTDSSMKKGCGPLLVALVSALKGKLGGAAVRVPGDILEAFSSTSLLLDWISRYSESVHSSSTAAPYQTKFGKTNDFISSVIQLTLQEWTCVLREHAAGRNNGVLAVSTSASVDTTLVDFRKMTTVSGSKLVAFIYERMYPSGKLNGSVGNGHSSRVAREQELTNKQKAWLMKFDSWAAQTFAMRSGKYNKNSSYGGGGAAGVAASSSAAAASTASVSTETFDSLTQKMRTCKLKLCLERDIASSSKYVVVRCSSGCISSMHPACFHIASSEAQQQKASVDKTNHPSADETANKDSIPCPRAQDKSCKGAIIKALMKQQHKIITWLLPVRDESKDMRTSSHTDSDEADTEVSHCSDDACEDSSNVWASRRRGARKGASLSSLKTSKLKRMRTLEDGTVVFDDEIDRLEQAAAKAEKKRLAEEKKKKEAENVKRAASVVTVPSSTSSVSSTGPLSSTATAAAAAETKAKPFTFEVVVPLKQRTSLVNDVKEDNSVEKSRSSELPQLPLHPAVMQVPTLKTKVGVVSESSITPASAEIIKKHAYPVQLSWRAPEKQVVTSTISLLRTPTHTSYATAAKIPESAGTIGEVAPIASNGKSTCNSTPRKQRTKQTSTVSPIPRPIFEALHPAKEKTTDFPPCSADKKVKKPSRREARARDIQAAVPAAAAATTTATTTETLVDSKHVQAVEHKEDSCIEELVDQKLDLFEAEKLEHTSVEAECVTPRMNPSNANSISRSDTPISMDDLFSSRPGSKVPSPGRDKDIILMQPRTAAPAPIQRNNVLLQLHNHVSSSPSSDIVVPNVVPASDVKIHRDGIIYPRVTMWEDVLASAGNAPSPVVLLRSVPFGVTYQALGMLFSQYGRVSVNLVHTAAHGFVATLKYEDIYHAATVINTLRGRCVKITPEQPPHQACVPHGTTSIPQWRMDNMVFGHYPISAIPLPTVQLMSFQKPNAVVTTPPVSSSFSLFDDLQPRWVDALVD